jgi:chromosome segregation ATPase
MSSHNSSNEADQNAFQPESWAGWEKYKGKVQEAGTEAAESGKGIDLPGLAARSLGGDLGKLAEAAGSFSNPLQAAATIGVAAIQAISKAVDDCNDRFAKLAASTQKVNDILHQLVGLRPTATDEWMKFTEQMAKLGEQGDKLRFAQGQMNSTLEGCDENKIKNAFDFEKPALERQAITDQISNVRSDLAYDQKHAGDVGAAQQHANETANTVADLKRQIQALPKAIQQARGNAKEALDEAKAHAGNP